MYPVYVMHTLSAAHLSSYCSNRRYFNADASETCCLLPDLAGLGGGVRSLFGIACPSQGRLLMVRLGQSPTFSEQWRRQEVMGEFLPPTCSPKLELDRSSKIHVTVTVMSYRLLLPTFRVIPCQPTFCTRSLISLKNLAKFLAMLLFQNWVGVGKIFFIYGLLYPCMPFRVPQNWLFLRFVAYKNQWLPVDVRRERGPERRGYESKEGSDGRGSGEHKVQRKRGVGRKESEGCSSAWHGASDSPATSNL